jgi:hypothetical protein
MNRIWYWIMSGSMSFYIICIKAHVLCDRYVNATGQRIVRALVLSSITFDIIFVWKCMTYYHSWFNIIFGFVDVFLKQCYQKILYEGYNYYTCKTHIKITKHMTWLNEKDWRKCICHIAINILRLWYVICAGNSGSSSNEQSFFIFK